MHSYILTGMRMGPFAGLLRKHGFTASPKNILRLLFIFQNSLWASFFAWREKVIFGKEIEKYPVPDEAVFIIGHWRTGSTFLHQLLASDPRFVAPSLFQVTFPESFLVSARFFRPVMGKVLKYRPMDRVELGFDDPQEDEFALLKLTGSSPLLEVIFSGRKEFFLNGYTTPHPPGNEKEHWQKQFRYFCRKITRGSGKIPLLKNPFHSLRIPLLLETFPNARFIHIHRHPYQVLASSMHLWKVMADDNQLKGKPYQPGLQEVAEGLRLFYDRIGEDLKLVPEGRGCEVAYEDLERDPAGEIKRIYEALGWEFTRETGDGIRAHLDRTRHFKKNSYIFGGAEKAVARQVLARQFEKYHYNDQA